MSGSGYPPEWALVDVMLAKSSRPGYPERQGIGEEEVDEWIERCREMGIKSIICLLSDDQLPFYSELSTDLIQYYRDAGFAVAHVPEEDYRLPPLSDISLGLVVSAFEDLEKPVLVHCSAGIARTGMAVAAIWENEME